MFPPFLTHVRLTPTTPTQPTSSTPLHRPPTAATIPPNVVTSDEQGIWYPIDYALWLDTYGSYYPTSI